MSAPKVVEAAFPSQGLDSSDPGMTLRDYFAAAALGAMLPLCIASEQKGALERAASNAYAAADAMLDAREKTK